MISVVLLGKAGSDYAVTGLGHIGPPLPNSLFQGHWKATILINILIGLPSLHNLHPLAPPLSSPSSWQPHPNLSLSLYTQAPGTLGSWVFHIPEVSLFILHLIHSLPVNLVSAFWMTQTSHFTPIFMTFDNKSCWVIWFLSLGHQNIQLKVGLCNCKGGVSLGFQHHQLILRSLSVTLSVLTESFLCLFRSLGLSRIPPKLSYSFESPEIALTCTQTTPSLTQGILHRSPEPSINQVVGRSGLPGFY